MPGIAGIINLNQTQEENKLKVIEAMANALSHSSACLRETISFDNGALAAVRLNVFPFHGLMAEDKSTALTFWGYLWNEEELRQKTGTHFNTSLKICISCLTSVGFAHPVTSFQSYFAAKA